MNDVRPDNSTFIVTLNVDIRSVTGASGNLYLKDTTESLQLTASDMASLIVKARYMLDQLIGEYR